MRTLRFFAICCLIGTLLQVFAYFNSMVSYKYEVDLMETNIITDKNISDLERKEQLMQLKYHERELTKQQFLIKALFWLFLIGLLICVYFIFIRPNSRFIR
ncbi:MAG: hypothetical protein JWQ25_2459 [Daejeonella sp.]|nr:hypothetical protein [Daejeonella sp.]